MCPLTPGVTPTGTTLTTSTADRITRFLSEGTPESSRRLIAYRCAMVLLILACALTAVICFQGMSFHPVDNGLLTALTFIVGIIAALAQQIYLRKSDASPKSGTESQGVGK